ncbi:MAG: ABC transporter permease [Terriglobia bacterium]|jgi:predicted permease
MNWRREPSKLGALFRRRKPVDDLEEEIRAHLEMEERENLEAGMPPEEAHYAALRRFGNVTLTQERSREMWGWESFETLWQDIRYGLRILAKNRGFTAVAVLTLAIGIGANTAIFSLINAVMLRMLPVQRPNELRLVGMVDPHSDGDGDTSFTNPLWEQVRDRQDVFSGVLAWSGSRFDLAQGGAVHYANGMWVSGDFFKTLELRPAAGRLITTSDDQRGCSGAAVLSYGFWQEHYGGAPSAIGSTLSLNDHPFEVVGVAPPGFYGMEVGRNFDVAIPICAATLFDGKKTRLDQRSYWWLRVAGRVKPGVSLSKLAARLGVLSPQIFTAALPQDWDSNGQKSFLRQVLVTTPAATGTSELRGQFDRPLQMLMGVVGLVLLIACANIASLMLARAAARQKDLAMRQALGASRLRLIRQLLTECVLLSSAGALVGILLARWGTALLVRYISTADNAVFLDLSLDRRVLGFTLAIAIFTSVLFGLLPELRATRVSLALAMKGGQAVEIDRRARFRNRHWIVASQVALSLVLLVAAGLFLRSFWKLATLDIGFDRNNVLVVGANLETAKVPGDQQLSICEAIESRLRALPGVVSVGRSWTTPVSGSGWNGWIETEWSKGLTGRNSLAWFNFVSPGYLGTLRMTLLAGRNFNDRDTKTAPAVVIVNQTLAQRFFPNLNPIGRTFRIVEYGKPGPPIEVVGVVRDSKYQTLREKTHPTAFFQVTKIPGDGEAETFELRTGVRPSGLVSEVQAAVAGVNKEIPLEFHTLSEQVNDSMVQERMLALLSGFFGTLALLLAMIGLYGTLSYLVAQRQTEFGIRMALGAERGSILRLVMRSVISVLAVGVVAGVGISLAATRVLQQLLFGLGPHDVVTMIAAVAVLSVVALIAGYLPARRAMKVDPMVALRNE